MPNKTYRIIAVWMLLLIVGMLSCKSLWANDQHVKILSMDDQGFNVELTLPHFELKDVQGTDGNYQRINIDDWARTSIAGLPELPVKGMLIQAPQSGGIEIVVIRGVYESIPNCKICPVPEQRMAENGEVIAKFIKDDETYNASEYFPGILTDVDSRGILRDVPVARMNIYPFQWNPATKELRYYTKLNLRVRFEDPLLDETSGKFGRETIFEKMAKKTIINYKRREKIGRRPFANLDEPAVPGKEALRIEVKQDGIYRITYDDLLSAGLKPRQIDPSTYQLFNRGDEVAIKVVLKRKRRGKFTPGSFIEFYSLGIDSIFTDTNIYWLRWNEGKGKRISQLNGEVTGDGEKINSFFEKLHIEKNQIIWQQTPDAPEQDFWFWKKLTAPVTGEFSLNIPSPDLNQTKVNIRVAFQGRSTVPASPNHHTVISLDGTIMSDNFWDNDIEFIEEFAFTPALLSDGLNRFTVELPGDTKAEVDVVYVNWFEVDYLRLLEAEQDSLTFTINGDGRLQIEVANLGNSEIMVYDISDPLEVKDVVNFSIESDSSGNMVIFNDQVSGEKTYHILTTRQIRQPDRIILWQPSDLKNPINGADYILITSREFLPSVEPLLDFRESQGLRVMAVSVEDIYNEFNSGLFDPAAIKDFLKFAFENWEQPVPTYVLMIGDSNSDYRDFLDTGKENIAPVHHSITKELGLTPDDTWYVSVAGDDVLPDMLIGRISGNSPEIAAKVVDKIVRYEESVGFRPESVLLVADECRPGFEAINEELAGSLPSEFSVDRAYLSTFENVDDVTQAIISSIDKGMLITNYVGHGAVRNWASENIFLSEDVDLLSNRDKLTFVITLNCLNGFFSQQSFYGLADEFVIAEDKGAIGAFSSSTLGFEWEHNILNKEIFSLLFDDGINGMGPLTTQTKINSFANGITLDTMISYTLFGDPAGMLRQ